MAWKQTEGWKGTPEEAAAAAAAAGGNSTPSGTFLDPTLADVNDGADVAFTKSGNSIQAVIEAMSGSASTKPSTLQRVLFWSSGIEAQNILDLVAEIIPTTTIEEASTITAPIILVVGDVAVPSGGAASLANLATYKSRWVGIRINGPNVQQDAGQDDSNFGWSGNLALDVTDPTDYTWLSRLRTLLFRTRAGQSKFADLRPLMSYAGSNGAHSLKSLITEQADDNVNDDDTIYRFVGIGRQATGGVQRTIAFTVDSLTAVKAT